MAQPGVSLRRDDPQPERVPGPYLVLARDAAAEDMAEIARSGVPRHVRSAVARPASRRRPAPVDAPVAGPRPVTALDPETSRRPRPVPAPESAVDARPAPIDGGAPIDGSAPIDGGALIDGSVPGRRTIIITGRGSERYVPARRRPQRPIHERPGFQPDRFAMWAVLLGVLLVLVAATSAHAALHVSHASSRAALIAVHR